MDSNILASANRRPHLFRRMPFKKSADKICHMKIMKLNPLCVAWRNKDKTITISTKKTEPGFKALCAKRGGCDTSDTRKSKDYDW
ncbi:hypothetical protein HDU97_002152 [Phlyctochytrium planicorne]|nr:hypothetical protein HDU97_002152 [Phlyctochytrium planicorne]